MVYMVEFPEDDALEQYEMLARSGTPIFLLEAPPPEGQAIQVQLQRGAHDDGTAIPNLWEHEPRILMIEGPRRVRDHEIFQEGIVEEVSDDEEEERVSRARKGKFIMEEDMTPLTESGEGRAGERMKEVPF